MSFAVIACACVCFIACACLQVCMCVCRYVCMFECIYVCMFVCMRVYAFLRPRFHFLLWMIVNLYISRFYLLHRPHFLYFSLQDAFSMVYHLLEFHQLRKELLLRPTFWKIQHSKISAANVVMTLRVMISSHVLDQSAVLWAEENTFTRNACHKKPIIQSICVKFVTLKLGKTSARNLYANGLTMLLV